MTPGDRLRKTWGHERKGEEDIGVCVRERERIWKGREIWGREVRGEVCAGFPRQLTPVRVALTRPDFLWYLAPPNLLPLQAQSPAFAAAEALQGMVTASR